MTYRTLAAPFLTPAAPRLQKKRVSFSGFLTLTAAAVGLAHGQTAAPDFGDTDLEKLINMKVTSVSRKEKSLALSPGAIFVITQDDIRRSGLSSIPELLRLVPGMDVARIDANKWAISARGFNERFADKMLVMIDGRSVLSPLSSGVYWDAQDTILEDIDRIEVVRGPGAALWGANAVNGVINIFTKTAKETQGALLTVSAGTEGRTTNSVRYGGEAGRRGYYRLFAKNDNVSDSTNDSGVRAGDSFRMLRGGFRADWNLSTRDTFTINGNFYRGNAGQTTDGILSLSNPLSATFGSRTALTGGNFESRWSHASSDRFDTSIQMYVDGERRDQTRVLSDFRKTMDLELLQHFSAPHGNELTWGGDYRHDIDDTRGSAIVSFSPANRSTNLFGIFLQDEFMIRPDSIWLTVGSKLEHNSYSGFALQPNLRALWAPRRNQSVWAAFSQAAENSARTDADIRVTGSPSFDTAGRPTVETHMGTVGLPPESVQAFELGYRARVNQRFELDLAGFSNRYMNRHTHEPIAPFLAGDPGSPYTVLPTITASKIRGETRGAELSLTTQVSKTWKVVSGYTLFSIHLHTASDSGDDSTVPDTEGGSPRQQFQIRSFWDASRKLACDTAFYLTSRLPGPEVPSVARLDFNLIWHLTPKWDLTAGGQNLLDRRHFEFGSGDLVNAAPVSRNLFTKLTWRY